MNTFGGTLGGHELVRAVDARGVSNVRRLFERECRACGCTEARACAGGCAWVEADLCSACAVRPKPLEEQLADVDKQMGARRVHFSRIVARETMGHVVGREERLSRVVGFEDAVAFFVAHQELTIRQGVVIEEAISMAPQHEARDVAEAILEATRANEAVLAERAGGR